jgi:hypothetical protein
MPGILTFPEGETHRKVKYTKGEIKFMKKNVMMRLASFLLVAVLISTSAISGTYAKYTTADTAGDSARVAKFGVVVDVDGTMFAEIYDDEAHGNDAVIAASDYVTVSSDGTGSYKKLVAPGTKGDMAAITITGTPEVDVAVTYTADVTISGWAVTGDDFYCPLVFTISGNAGDCTVNGLDFASAAALVTELETVVADYSKTYDTGTDLSTKAAENLAISWEWPYESYEGGVICDEKDTALGDAAAANVANASTIAIDITCTVTQVD